MHEDVYAVKDLTMNLLHQTPMTLVVRGKVDSERYSDSGPSVRYTAVRAAQHSFAEHNESLLKQLTAYGEQVDGNTNA